MMVVFGIVVLFAHLVPIDCLRLSEPLGDVDVLPPNLHPKFVGSKSRYVNGCNRVASSWCHPKERDSATEPECHDKLHELASSGRVNSSGDMLIVGNGLKAIGDIKGNFGIDTVSQGPATAAQLREMAPKSAGIVLFNYHLHHAADDTIALLQAANRVAKDFVIIAEDLKTMRPRDWKLEFEDDASGTHRGDEEWKALFELLGMRKVAEEQPICMSVQHPVSRKLYVLRPNHKAESANLERMKEALKRELPFPVIWDCVNADFIEWLDKSTKEKMKVLDVGGGRARLKAALEHTAIPPAKVTEGRSYDYVEYDCIDFNPTVNCPAFDGRSLGNFSDFSYHSVMFHSTLHHAADTTISLLKDARRVAQKYVIVAEDLKADRNADYELKWVQHHHDPHGTFRGDREWKNLFDLLDLRLVHEAGPRMCGDNMDVGRQLYILEVPDASR